MIVETRLGKHNGMKKFFAGFFTSVIHHNIGAQAAIIAFFSFSSMIPILLLMLYGATLIISPHAVVSFFVRIIQTYLPISAVQGNHVLFYIERLVRVRANIGFIGLIGLLWTTLGGFTALQRILDIIVGADQQRSFVKKYVIGFITLGIFVGLTIIASFIIILSPHLLGQVTENPVLMRIRLVHLIARVSLPFIIFATCYGCYWILPSHKMSHFALLIGASTSTVGLYVVREAFVIYSHHLGRYELIYGALTFIMLLTFWIYVMSIVFLIGAEVAAATYETRKKGEHPR